MTARVIPFPATLFDSMRRTIGQLTTDEKLNLIDALVEHPDLNCFYECDEIARQVGNIRGEIAPAETLDPYGIEQFRAAAYHGSPL